MAFPFVAGFAFALFTSPALLRGFRFWQDLQRKSTLLQSRRGRPAWSSALSWHSVLSKPAVRQLCPTGGTFNLLLPLATSLASGNDLSIILRIPIISDNHVDNAP